MLRDAEELTRWRKSVAGADLTEAKRVLGVARDLSGAAPPRGPSF